MCGIAGYITKNVQIDKAVGAKMLEQIQHRGPDDINSIVYPTKEGEVFLGHVRLAILDLNARSNQPFVYEHLSMVYNGEVYNFEEIRAELEKQNYSFDTSSDTEVILKAYHYWGIACFERFNGMFAAAIWDEKSKELLLFRDRLGVKPLYVAEAKDKIYFASELKAFQHIPDLDFKIYKAGLNQLLSYGYIDEQRSIFQSIKKIQPGTYQFIGEDLSEKEDRYFDIEAIAEQNFESEEDLIDQLEKKLKQGFERRLVADVPVGVFLSGGIDSSLVASLLAKDRKDIHTYTIGFDHPDYDESVWAKKISEHLGTKHKEFIVSLNDVKELISEIPNIIDEPMGDSSILPTYLVSKMASQEVKVVLSADGGDELFLGYRKYQKQIEWSKFTQKGFVRKFDGVTRGLGLNNQFKLWNTSIGKAKSWLKRSKVDEYDWMRSYSKGEGIEHSFDHFLQYSSSYYLNKVLKPDYQVPTEAYMNKIGYKGDDIQYMMLHDVQNYMASDILRKVDIATMANSIEGREPFLDKDLVEFSLSIPSHYKTGEAKGLLKKVLEKYVPRPMFERPKHGFVIPIYDWLKGDLRTWMESYFEPNFIKKQAIFDLKGIRSLLDDFFADKLHYQEKVWNLLIFQIWYRQFFEE